MKTLTLLHKIIASVVCSCGLLIWLGRNPKLGDSSLMVFLVLFILVETLYPLWFSPISRENVDFGQEKSFAPIWKRVLAQVVDYILINIVTFSISKMFGGVDGLDFLTNIKGFNIGVYMGPYALILYILYFIAFESSELQATPGKLLFRIKVLNNGGETLSVSQALYRQLGKINELACLIIFIIVDICSIIIRKDRKTFHDIIGESVVVEKR